MLSIRDVAVGAFTETRLHWRALGTALALPAAALCLLGVAADRLDRHAPWAYLVSAAETLVQALFAVSCHRIVLLGEPSLENRWSLHWSARETRFLLWLVLPGLAVWAFLALPLLLSSLALLGVLGIAAWYVLARASLILPAIAIDERRSFGSAWELSRGNGWRLALALALPGLIFSAPDYVCVLIFGESRGELVSIARRLWFSVAAAVEIAALSVAFRALSSAEARQGAATGGAGATSASESSSVST